jgi:hypothetical protein
MSEELKWIPCHVFEGMRLKYNSVKMGRLSFRSPLATVRKNGKGLWYAAWDKEGNSAPGAASGIKDDAIFECWLIAEEQATQDIDIKTSNTMPDSTNCVKCGHVLKDLGMGPQFKFCPICEP